MATGSLPPRCLGRCPALEFELDSYRLGLRRNCDGPVASIVSETDGTVQVFEGGLAYEQAGKQVLMGEIVCRNQGLVESLDERIKLTGEEQ